jgi:hypothetical protein
VESALVGVPRTSMPEKFAKPSRAAFELHPVPKTPS